MAFIELKPNYFTNKEIRFASPYNKIVGIEEAKRRINGWRGEGQKVVMIDVVLDIPHLAHAEYLSACANLGDKLVVRINSDNFVASRKDPRGPIVTWRERAEHAAHYPYIDLITIKEEGGWTWLLEYNPDIVVKSTTSGVVVLNEIEQLRPYLERLGTQVVVMDEYARIVPIEQTYQKGLEYEQKKFTTERISGSIIRRKIIERAVEDKINFS